MAQASLTPGPGVPVRDALAPSWDLDSEASPGTETGAWVEAPWSGTSQVVLTLGTLAGTITSGQIEIQAADADDADGDPDEIVRLGQFGNITASDSDAVFVLEIENYHRYLRAVMVTVGTGADVVAAITVESPHAVRGLTVGSGAVIS